MASSSRLLFRNPNPIYARPRLPPLGLHLLHVPRRFPPPSLAPRRGPSPSLAISAVAIPFQPPPSISTVIQLARPLPRLLLASVRSIPGHLSAVAARAAPTPAQLAALRALFAAALANRPPAEYFRAPLQAVASGAATCITLYCEILSLMVTLTWFPNIPWEKQPFSAIRDLCDPFLSLCRVFLPPIKKLGNLDLSPLLAFWVLGVISSLLSGNNPSASVY